MCAAAVTWSTEIGINISSRPGLLAKNVSVQGGGNGITAFTYKLGMRIQLLTMMIPRRLMNQNSKIVVDSECPTEEAKENLDHA